jgi:histidinol-phosphatase (PHP family)
MQDRAIIDLHMHSTFSSDGKNTLADMAQAALNSGLTTICFTEHVDYNPRDQGFGYYDHEAYHAAIERAREAFSGRLEILMGIEFAEPHLHPRELERERTRDYDMIIGSQHSLGSWFFDEPQMIEEYTREGVFMQYYEELMRMVRLGGFDVLGHVGFPSRYIGDFRMPDASARALAELLASSGIVPEINTSGFRKGYFKTLPDENFLRIYRACSDGRVTIGSDAHRISEPGGDLDQALAAIRTLGLAPVVFRKRQAGPV